MRALVVYESMYGNTRRIAEAIGRGLAKVTDVTVVPAVRATPELTASADLVVVGGPTHVHGMSRPATRKAAAEAAKEPQGPRFEADAAGAGIREWLLASATLPPLGAAFDTRMAGPSVFTGRAARGVATRLRRRGCLLVTAPESFLVTKRNVLREEEEARAEEWGIRVARCAAFATDDPADSHASTSSARPR
jgi:flavodoxin-like protein